MSNASRRTKRKNGKSLKKTRRKNGKLTAEIPNEYDGEYAEDGESDN